MTSHLHLNRSPFLHSNIQFFLPTQTCFTNSNTGSKIKKTTSVLSTPVGSHESRAQHSHFTTTVIYIYIHTHTQKAAIKPHTSSRFSFSRRHRQPPPLSTSYFSYTYNIYKHSMAKIYLHVLFLTLTNFLISGKLMN